jgi:hypothetical protein
MPACESAAETVLQSSHMPYGLISHTAALQAKTPINTALGLNELPSPMACKFCRKTAQALKAPIFYDEAVQGRI